MQLMFNSKGMWAAIFVVGITIVVLIFAGKTRSANNGGGDNAAKQPTEMYIGLRNQMLAFPAPEIKDPSKTEGPVAYGVIMDLPMSSGTATIVSLYTGDTSMYTSTGGGIIGGIGHESCRIASKQFIKVAQGHLNLMHKTDTFPVPPHGVFRFYVMTTGGIYTAEDKEEVLKKLSGPLADLFKAGDHVITQLRLISPE